MKRQNNLFEQIIDYQNIRFAFLKAVRGNRSSPAVINFCRNTESNLAALRDKLSSLHCGWGNYHSFFITDPKLRLISTAPIEQRIMHHAIMNVLEPLFNRPIIHHSYACRKGKGTHAAVLYAFKQCKAKPCFLKLDVRKYFDSIEHSALKTMLQRYIKDMRVIILLNEIIDSYKTAAGRGVPIGNLTSQYFANLYLAGLDHFILEELQPDGFCRYMDDFVLWSSSQKQLRAMLEQINNYITDKLCLNVKQPVFGKTKNGLPFLGFNIKATGIYLLQKSKRRVKTRMKEIGALLGHDEISEEKAAQRAQSVFAAIKLARTQKLRRALIG